MERKNLIWTGIAVVLIIALAYNFFGGATVSAQGYSSLEVQPDEVSVYLTVETRDIKAEVAKDLNVVARDKVISSLKGIGLDEEIKLINYNIYPEYNWEKGQELIGYVARYEIVIKTDNFELVPSIVDKSVDSGAGVSYIAFDLSEKKRSEYKAQALEEASKDAMTKASATADGLGKGLGRLVSVESQDFNYIPFRAYDSAVSEGKSVQDAAINIAPQDLEVTASVSVTYKISAF